MFCANTPWEQPAATHSQSTRSQALEEPCPASSVYRPLSEGTTFLTISLWVRPSGVTEIWCLSLAWRGWLLCSHRGSWQGVHSTHWNSASPASAQRTSESGCRNRTGMAAGETKSCGKETAGSGLQLKLLQLREKSTGSCGASEHWVNEKKEKLRCASVPNSAEKQKSRFLSLLSSETFVPHSTHVLAVFSH